MRRAWTIGMVCAGVWVAAGAESLAARSKPVPASINARGRANYLPRMVSRLRIETAGGSAVVVSRPLAATFSVEVRPVLRLDLADVRASKEVTSAALTKMPRGRGVRAVVTLRTPRWVRTRRVPRAIEIELWTIPGPRVLDSAAALYPRFRPVTIPEVAAGATCPDVGDALAYLRREPGPTIAQVFIKLIRRKDACSNTARLAFGEAAIRLGRGELAAAVLLAVPSSLVRDRLLAVAAHAAGDLSLASEAYARVGRENVGDDLIAAAEAHLLAGDPEKARRWLRAALRAGLGRDLGLLGMRLVDTYLLAGQASAAISMLRKLAEQQPAIADDADLRRLSLSSPAPTTLRLLGGDSAAQTDVGMWYRALRRYVAGDEAGLAELTLYMRRDMSQSHYAGAVGDLLSLYTLELLRAAARDRDWSRVALAVSVRPALLDDDAHGAELCGIAEAAYMGLGLTLAAERTARHCLPRQRATGQERVALFAIAEAQRSRSEHVAALRTLRYLAGRDPLAAAVDPRFWAAFGETQLHAGRFPEGMQALQRALDEGDAVTKAAARRALGDALIATGHHHVGLALFASGLPRSKGPSSAPAAGAKGGAKGEAAAPTGGQGKGQGGQGKGQGAAGAASPVAKEEDDIRSAWDRVARGLRAFDDEEARQR